MYRAKGSVSENKRTVHIPPKSTKMSIDKVPIVTTLLRAARSQDEDTLRQLLDNILKNGISEIELNADDSSGRVSAHNSIEYQHLRFLLHILTIRNARRTTNEMKRDKYTLPI